MIHNESECDSRELLNRHVRGLPLNLTFKEAPQVARASLELAEEVGRICQDVWWHRACHCDNQMPFKLVKCDSKLSK